MNGPEQLELRQRAVAEFQRLPAWKRPTKLVVVRCPKCNITYAANDLTSLLETNRHGPITGPCVICHEYTTEVIHNEK